MMLVVTDPQPIIDALASGRRIAVLTGAGCSTLSGIPDYRDRDGEWKHARPVLFQDFINDTNIRKRYWARSMAGWHHFSRARPNPAHRALAALERSRLIDGIITQNVDGLHQQAGSQRVIDLHGNLSRVICLACGHTISRESLQRRLEQENPGWAHVEAPLKPDGDVDIEANFHDFQLSDCLQCGGMLKPDVVFFGESVPQSRVRKAIDLVDLADVLLVIGSSLMVWSGLRFVRRAHEYGKACLLVNLGRTRGDEFFMHRVDSCCGTTLQHVVSELGLTG